MISNNIRKFGKFSAIHLLSFCFLFPHISLATDTTVESITVVSQSSIGKTLADGDTLTINDFLKVSGTNVKGVILNGTSTVNVGGKITVYGNDKNSGHETFGINILENGKVTAASMEITGNATGIKMAGGTITIGTDGISIGDNVSTGDATTSNANGVEVIGGTNNVINSNININTNTTGRIRGVYILEGDVTINGNITVAGSTKSSGHHNIGIYRDNKASGTTNINGNLKAIDSGTGLNLSIQDDFNFSGNIEVTSNLSSAQNKSTTGMYLSLSINADPEKQPHVTIKSDSITVAGYLTTGINTHTNTTIGGNTEEKTILKVTSGNNATGIGVYAGKTNFTGDAFISADNSDAFSLSGSRGAELEVNGNITNSGEKSAGVFIEGGKFTSTGTITVSGKDSQGIYAIAGVTSTEKIATVDVNDVTVSGENSIGVLLITWNTRPDTIATGTIRGTINVTGDDAVGVYATKYSGPDGTEVIADVLGNVNVSGNESVGIYSARTSIVNMKDKIMTVNPEEGDTATGFAVGDGGIINLENVEGTAKDNGVLIAALFTGGGIVSATNSNLTGNVVHEGEIVEDVSAGTLSLTLSEESSLTGSINVGDVSADPDKKIDVTLSSENDIWNVTGNSITNGKLSNSGKINFDNLNDSFKTVTVKEYSAAGDNASLYLKADVDAEKSDQLVIDGNATGSTKVFVRSTVDSLGLKTRMGRSLILANDWAANGSDAEFNLANSQGYVDAGGYKYILEQDLTNGGTGDDMEWYLVNNGLSPSGETLALGSIIVPEIWYLETETLFNRMQVYNDKDYKGGFWMATGAKKIKHSRPGSYGSFDQTLYTMSLGWDKKKERSNGNWFTGIMAGYGEDDRDSINGIGNIDMKSFQTSIYTINQRDNGLYMGGLIKYNRYRSDITARINDSYEKIGGHLNQDGLGTSFILGKRFERKNGWYLEPEAQISYLRIFEDSYTSNSGSRIKVHDGDSFRIRGGLTYGRKRTFKSGSELDVYINASLVHEFDGETDVVIDNTKLTSDFGGTWGSYGIGAIWKLKNGNFLNAKVYYSDGNKRTEPWGCHLSFTFRM
ncbi:autotransporter outer membrane beta-barrel domain-containing protein [Selenomonadales bacterium OttesenSCG-928-I06]|nr:autotransporter outer membrane beta-barrel domain-containing protein [Selenomonadales bacterium OttesenSCG-928-I06]